MEINKKIFISILILIVIIWIFKYTTTNTSTIIALLIGFVIIYYYNINYNETKEKEKNMEETKKKHIIPKNNIQNKTILDFLFSVQDMYAYSPAIYKELVNLIEDFYNIKNYIKNNNRYVNPMYSIIDDKKRHVLNCFQSLIYSTKADIVETNRFNDKMDELKTIIDIEMEEVKKIHEKDVYNGIDNYTRLIPSGPAAFNQFQSIYDFF